MSTRHRLTHSVAGALAIAALAAPAAGAFPAEQVQGSTNPNAPATPIHVNNTSAGPAPTVSRTIDDGFDVGSAAIGAGGAAAVLLLSAAGASALVHRRHQVGMPS
jgi:hypothetical protein